jgi:hypothetical protein
MQDGRGWGIDRHQTGATPGYFLQIVGRLPALLTAGVPSLVDQACHRRPENNRKYLRMGFGNGIARCLFAMDPGQTPMRIPSG